MMLTNNRLRFIPAFLYLIFISILFFLPGSAFPENNWLSAIWFDKWLHVGLFAVLVLVWCWAAGSDRPVKIGLFVPAIYGICVELIQHNFVANRSFDLGDWIADLAGIMLGYVVWKRYVKK